MSELKGTSIVSRLIRATPMAVYDAFLDPGQRAAWMAPEGMSGHVHSFDPRPGGGYRMSLTYDDAGAFPGKSTPDTDTFGASFVELVPGEKIVEVATFESDDPAFHGDMVMTTSLAAAEDGTLVTMTFSNIPSGIRPEDNDTGARSSLAKLAAMLE